MLNPVNNTINCLSNAVRQNEIQIVELNSPSLINKETGIKIVNISPFSKIIEEDKNEENEINSKNLKSTNRNNSRNTKWTKQEDMRLKELILQIGTKNWEKIIEKFSNKSISQCIYRWYKVIKPSIRNEDWSEEEDIFLEKYISLYGTKSWTNCAKEMNGGRTARNCKERWYKVLSLKQDANTFFSPKDDLTLLVLVRNLGTCWSKIIKFFPQKKENQIKNRCYSILRKYAIDFFHNNEKYSNKIKSIELKASQILLFLPTAIEGLKNIIGQKIYEEILREHCGSKSAGKNQYNSSHVINIPANICLNTTPCRINKNEKIITINLCTNCKNKLKEQIKKKIYTKMIQNQINTLNIHTPHQMDFTINFKASEMISSNINLEVFNSFNNRIKNTGMKVESIKDMLKSFIDNVA